MSVDIYEFLEVQIHFLKNNTTESFFFRVPLHKMS